MIKESIHREHIAILNVYVPNNRTLTKTEGKMDTSTIIAEDINTSLSQIDRTNRPKNQ